VRLELYRRPGTAWKEGQRAVIRNHEIVAFLAGAVMTCGTGSAVREKGNKGTDEWGRLAARGRSDACGRLLRASDGVGPGAQ